MIRPFIWPLLDRSALLARNGLKCFYSHEDPAHVISSVHLIPVVPRQGTVCSESLLMALIKAGGLHRLLNTLKGRVREALTIKRVWQTSGRLHVSRLRNISRDIRFYRQRRNIVSRLGCMDPQALEALKCSGFAKVKPTERIVKTLIEVATKKLENVNAFELNKKHRMELLSKDDLRLDSIFVRFALQPHVLNVAANYLGYPPVIQQIKLLYSVPQES